MVNYLVTEYLTGTIPLEDIWNTLDETNQLELVDPVVRAVDELQKLGDVKNVCEHLTATPYVSNDKETPIAIGGPGIGYFSKYQEFPGGNTTKSWETARLQVIGD